MNGLRLGQLVDGVSLGNGPGDVGPFGSHDRQAATRDAVDMLLPMVPALGTIIVLFLLWRMLRVSRRPGRTETRFLQCPVLGRMVKVEFQRDPKDTRLTEVNWCTAHRPAVIVECKKRCLKVRDVAIGRER